MVIRTAVVLHALCAIHLLYKKLSYIMAVESEGLQIYYEPCLTWDLSTTDLRISWVEKKLDTLPIKFFKR